MSLRQNVLLIAAILILLIVVGLPSVQINQDLSITLPSEEYQIKFKDDVTGLPFNDEVSIFSGLKLKSYKKSKFYLSTGEDPAKLFNKICSLNSLQSNANFLPEQKNIKYSPGIITYHQNSVSSGLAYFSGSDLLDDITNKCRPYIEEVSRKYPCLAIQSGQILYPASFLQAILEGATYKLKEDKLIFIGKYIPKKIRQGVAKEKSRHWRKFKKLYRKKNHRQSCQIVLNKHLDVEEITKQYLESLAEIRSSPIEYFQVNNCQDTKTNKKVSLFDFNFEKENLSGFQASLLDTDGKEIENLTKSTSFNESRGLCCGHKNDHNLTWRTTEKCLKKELEISYLDTADKCENFSLNSLAANYNAFSSRISKQCTFDTEKTPPTQPTPPLPEVTDPILELFNSYENLLKSKRCYSDTRADDSQIRLLSSVYQIKLGYINGDYSKEQILSWQKNFEDEIARIFSNCQNKDFSLLSVPEIKQILSGDYSREQAAEIAINLDRHAFAMQCENTLALSSHFYNTISSLKVFYGTETSSFTLSPLQDSLELIEHCNEFEAGKFISLNSKYSGNKGIILDVTWKACGNNQNFKYTQNENRIILEESALSKNCYQPSTYQANIAIGQDFNYATNYLIEAGDKSLSVNINTNTIIDKNIKIYDIMNLPQETPGNVLGMYSYLYATKKSSTTFDPEARSVLIGQNNISSLTKTELLTVFPPELATSKISIFNSYNANAQSSWNNHPLINHIDLSGVAWDISAAGTLISRKHIVMAAHYARGLGKISFHDREGNLVQRNIVRIDKITGTDVAVGLLDSEVPSGIKHYRLLYNNSNINDLPLIMTNQFRQVGIKRVFNTWKSEIINGHNVVGDSSLNHQSLAGYESSEFNLVNGDSGHPSFALINGELVLILTNTSYLGGANYSSHSLQMKIRDIITEDYPEKFPSSSPSPSPYSSPSPSLSPEPKSNFSIEKSNLNTDLTSSYLEISGNCDSDSEIRLNMEDVQFGVWDPVKYTRRPVIRNAQISTGDNYQTIACSDTNSFIFYIQFLGDSGYREANIIQSISGSNQESSDNIYLNFVGQGGIREVVNWLYPMPDTKISRNFSVQFTCPNTYKISFNVLGEEKSLICTSSTQSMSFNINNYENQRLHSYGKQHLDGFLIRAQWTLKNPDGQTIPYNKWGQEKDYLRFFEIEENGLLDSSRNQTMVIYNANLAESLEVARFYATGRNIPEKNLCGVYVPDSKFISFSDYISLRKQIINRCYCNSLSSTTSRDSCLSTGTVSWDTNPFKNLVYIYGIPERIYASKEEHDKIDEADLLNYEPTLDDFLAKRFFSSSGLKQTGQHFAYGRIDGLSVASAKALAARALQAERSGNLNGDILENYLNSPDSEVKLRNFSHQTNNSANSYFSFTDDLPPPNQAMGSPIAPLAYLGNNYGWIQWNQAAIGGLHWKLRSWLKTNQSCTRLCSDFSTDSERLSCQQNSTDYYKELNTGCVGVKDGFFGHQLISYGLANYTIYPSGWNTFHGETMATESPLVIENNNKAFKNSLFSDPYYLRFGKKSDLSTQKCYDAGDNLSICKRPLPVVLSTTGTMPAGTSMAYGSKVKLKLRLRYPKQKDNSNIELMLCLPKCYQAKQIFRSTYQLNQTINAWNEVNMETAAVQYPDFNTVEFKLYSQFDHQIEDFLEVDAVELSYSYNNQLTSILANKISSFSTKESMGTGDWAANFIERLGATAFWGSTSHYITGGWAYGNSDRYLHRFFQGTPLGETVTRYSIPQSITGDSILFGFGGTQSGLFYGDPLYQPFKVSIRLANYSRPIKGFAENGHYTISRTNPYSYNTQVIIDALLKGSTQTWKLEKCILKPNEAENLKTATEHCNNDFKWQTVSSENGSIENKIVYNNLLDLVLDQNQNQSILLRVVAKNTSNNFTLSDVILLHYLQ